MFTPDTRTGKQKTIDNIIKGIETATILLKAWSLSPEEHRRIQRELDNFQIELDVHRTGCDRAQTPIEYHLEEAELACHGRLMTEEEWQYVRSLWIQVGTTFAPCRPSVDAIKETEEDDFDRAMEFLK